MKADTSDVVAVRFISLLQQQLRALLPQGSTSISMGVTHTYSEGGTIANFNPRLSRNGNNIKVELGANEVSYFGYELGYNEDGSKRTPRIPAEGQAREAANYQILDTAIRNTCEALGLEFENVTWSVTGVI